MLRWRPADLGSDHPQNSTPLRPGPPPEGRFACSTGCQASRWTLAFMLETLGLSGAWRTSPRCRASGEKLRSGLDVNPDVDEIAWWCTAPRPDSLRLDAHLSRAAVLAGPEPGSLPGEGCGLGRHGQSRHIYD